MMLFRVEFDYNGTDGKGHWFNVAYVFTDSTSNISTELKRVYPIERFLSLSAELKGVKWC